MWKSAVDDEPKMKWKTESKMYERFESWKSLLCDIDPPAAINMSIK